MKILLVILLFVTFTLLVYGVNEYIKTNRKHKAFKKEKEDKKTS